MTQDHKVGKGRPPKHSQFKKGVSGNPNGRPKRAPFSVAQAILNVLDGPAKYKEGGKVRIASRRELSARNYVRRALAGDIGSAAILLKLLAHAERFGHMGARKIIVRNWLPDYEGQTAAQKTREFAANRERKPPKPGLERKQSHEPQEELPLP
ncbi:DUF5681 domain-containing protein [Bradyrhizobium sp. 62B]|uniref:DUF5681 domain-containing protein n=1 Tax=Bradyrhizobium sp. 62B TaxID=2898442 RepID=UPI0035D72338